MSSSDGIDVEQEHYPMYEGDKDITRVSAGTYVHHYAPCSEILYSSSPQEPLNMLKHPGVLLTQCSSFFQNSKTSKIK